MTRLVTALWFFILSSLPVSADTLRADLAEIMETRSLPALGYAVIKNGAVDEVDVLGDASRDAMFRAGSISKTVTTLLLLSLEADGVLSLERPLKSAIPELQLENETGRPILIADLLEQTSGLAGTGYADYKAAPTDQTALKTVLDRSFETRWPPGMFFSYANVNHTLAAAVAEKATGQPYDRLVVSHVLEPLSMYESTFDRLKVDRLVASFDPTGQLLPPWDLQVRPSGALIATIDDLAGLTLFLATDSDLVPRMRTPQRALVAREGYPFIYGAGLFPFIENGEVFYGHWGRIDGFQAVLGTNPETGSGFVAITNGADRQAFGAVRARLAAEVRGASVPELSVRNDQPFADLSGWWVPFTDDSVVRAWISEITGMVHVSQQETSIDVTPAITPWSTQTLSKIAPGQYAQDGFPVATHVFAQAETGETYLLGDGQLSLREVSSAEALLRCVGALALLVSLTLLPLVAVGLLVRRMRGLEARQPYVWPSIVVGGVAALTLIVLHVKWGMLSAIPMKLAEPGPHALTLFALSLCWLISSALGLVFWVRRPVAAFSSIMGAAVLLTFGLAISYLVSFGFVPLLTWRS